MSLPNWNRIWLPLIFLLFLVAAFLRPVDRQQELRVLLVARTMVETGDWLHPTFQNRPRYRKPPLAYWTAATAMVLTGNRHSAFPPRVLTLLAAFAAVYLLRDLARKCGASDANAALLLLLSYGYLNFSPHAETDLWLLLGVTGSFWAWESNRGLASGCFMALGVLAKGPAALVIPLVAFCFLGNRTWKQVVLAMAPPLLAGGAWLWFLQTDPIAQTALRQELSDTFVESPHAGPFFYYLYTFPKMMLPGILLLPWLRNAKLPRLGVVWFIVTFLLLSITPSKQDHYALLLLPPAVLCLAAARLPALGRIAGGLVIAAFIFEVVSVTQSTSAANARFLKEVRAQLETVRETEAPLQPTTLHVVGINSAIFDWYLGRHVENTDSVLHAYARAKPGDAVIVVQKQKQYIEVLPEPELTASDAKMLRLFQRK